ncbi:uncharacterized protein [Nicotiana sylvestris]|uniref:uncharacterized protein n=1 Tax=Nicotiana sylvestris TaxID=4096 RepID=UPI00388C64E6
MDEDDEEKTSFTTPLSTYCYRVMPFGLKNAWATYIRANTTVFHNMMHKEIEDAAIKWTDDCQKDFDKIKDYLSKPHILVPSKLGSPLCLYLSVMDNSFGCVLGQHDTTCKKEHAVYYLTKKFTNYEVKYTLLERTYCALTWVAQKLRHYLLAYTTYLISRMDPLKYILQKSMPICRLAKWQILLIELNIVYVTRTTMKAQALADHLVENLVDDDYKPLSTYFLDEEVNSIEELVPDDSHVWKMYFDGAVNIKRVGIGEILISPIGPNYLATTRLYFFCTNNTIKYESCNMGLKIALDLDVHELLVMGDSDLLIRQAQGK